MNKLFSFLACIIISVSSAAQQSVMEINTALEACIALRTAIGSSNTAGLKAANTAFASCQTSNFPSLWIKEADMPSLNGHFIWDEKFIDKLVSDKSVRNFAQRYVQDRELRSSSSSGKVFIKNAAVAAKSSLTFCLLCRNRQELAVVTEPGGAVSLRVHIIDSDTWLNDTEQVNNGLPVRTKVVELSNDMTELEIEVINRSDKDISFVLIGN